MFAQAAEVAKQNPWLGYLVLAATGAWFAYSNWAWLKSKAAAAWARVPSVAPAKPVRLDALAHLDAAFAYFEAIGCKEGMDAIQLAGRHAFEHREAA